MNTNLQKVKTMLTGKEAHDLGFSPVTHSVQRTAAYEKMYELRRMSYDARLVKAGSLMDDDGTVLYDVVVCRRYWVHQELAEIDKVIGGTAQDKRNATEEYQKVLEAIQTRNDKLREDRDTLIRELLALEPAEEGK